MSESIERVIQQRDSLARRLASRFEREQELCTLLHSIWLYVDWRYVTEQLETAQKELWADVVEAVSNAHHPDEPMQVDRWWRPNPCTCGHPRDGHWMLAERPGCTTEGCGCQWYLRDNHDPAGTPWAEGGEAE